MLGIINDRAEDWRDSALSDYFTCSRPVFRQNPGRVETIDIPRSKPDTPGHDSDHFAAVLVHPKRVCGELIRKWIVPKADF